MVQLSTLQASRGLNKCLVYTTAELGRGLWPRKIFTDRSKAMLLLWFTISVIVCLCIYALVKFLFLIVVWPIFGKETAFWLSACSILIVVLLL